jgi:transcription elongation GreA/GreB family factor
MNGPIITGPAPDIRIMPGDPKVLETLLGRLEGRRPVRTVAFLRSGIERATVVEGTAARDFAGPGSTVLFRDDAGHTHRNTLAVPGDTTSRPDGLSVMTVMGAALPGPRPGQRMTCETPDGRMRSVCVLGVTSGSGGRFLPVGRPGSGRGRGSIRGRGRPCPVRPRALRRSADAAPASGECARKAHADT